MAGVNAVLDKVFGCCLGRRRHGSGSDGSVFSGAASADERTPLLNDRNGAGKSVGGRPSQGANKQGLNALANDAMGHDAVTKDTSPVSLGRRRRQINTSALHAVQERANIAYFNIDSSQLLPSSSSVAQRRAAMGASQRLSRRDQSRDRQADDEDLSAQRRRDLIAASDQAERLYTAAMKTEASRASTSKDGAEKEDSSIQSSPISLVRQVRLSVYDASHASTSSEDHPAIRPELVTNDSAQTARLSASDLHGSVSVSPSQGSATQLHGIRHVPSIHSLRTLRLGNAGDVVEGIKKLDDRRLHAGQDDEEEDWQQRGRTRSRRGLVWMDATDQAEQSEVAQRGRLQNVFEPNQHLEAEHSNADEIHNAIRLEGHANERRRNIFEQLKVSTQAHLSEMWEEAGNTSTSAAEMQ